MLPRMVCVFPVEPQSPNGKNIHLHKRWGIRRFQKERQTVRKTALFVPKVCKSAQKVPFCTLFRALSGIG